MKKILIILTAISTLTGCTKNFEKINTNPKEPTQVSGQYLYTGAQKNLVDILTSTDINENVLRLYAQYWTETTYFDESRYDLITRDIAQNFWTAIYRDVLRDLSAAKSAVQSADTTTDEFTPNADVRASQIATIDILEAYSYYILLATFGNIPYSEAINIAILQPKFDDGIVIHQALISRLTDDILTLESSTGGSSFTGGDIIYGGDNALWVKFAATLKMKLALLMADVPGKAAEAALAFEEGAQMTFTSSSDDAIFHYLGTTPNNNPLANDMNPELTARKDFVAANTIVDYMNTLNDPRRAAFFTMVGGDYKGGIYGTSNSYSANSKANPAIYALDAPSVVMDYTEVEFMLAEAAERGWNVAGTAADHYNKGIESSIISWGGTSTEVTDYLANPLVDYNMAAGTWKQKIGIQKWIAYYNRGFDGWTEWRRLDAPILNPPPDMTQADIPKRFTYPINEQTLNGANYAAASAAIGGDLKSTKLYWDKF